MEYALLLIAVTYAVSLGFGILLEKYLKMPWMFAALFFGMILSSFNLFELTLKDEPFQLFATLGMLFLLFMIGFNLDIKRMKRFEKEIFKGSILIVGFEACTVGSLLYFGFPAEVSNSPLVAIITALSFATVGEAILLPILAKYGIIKTTFGQLTLGIGTIDDILEVLTLLLIPFLPVFLPISQIQGFPDPTLVLLDLAGISILTLVSIKFGVKIRNILRKNWNFEFLRPLLILLVFFSFVVLGGFVFESLAAISAIFGGLVARSLLPKEKLRADERAVNFLGYIFLSPLFFLSVGANVSVTSILVYPLLIALIWFVAKGSKLLASYLLFHQLLGTKCSLLLGLGLSVRFSTSLIVTYVLLNSGLISLALYSALIATAIFMKPVILGILSWALSKGKPP
ncbi:MAG: cation:proton antiporter [Candidatus Bathyarchaeota archaeon]|nr:cation:proton antiporter [Candidatus Bathyarchaeota archaeon]MDH5494119.1 cation:proton antiporter [Candidatus Bathyarchaeota archaeon]